MNGIANRLDRSFSFEVTAERPEDVDEDDVAETGEEREKLEKSLQTVIDLSEPTKLLKLGGSTVLRLSESKKDFKDTAVNKPAKKK